MELVWEQVFENQRWTVSKGLWAPCPIINDDPALFTFHDYTQHRYPNEIPLPISETSYTWVWSKDWSQTKWIYSRRWSPWDINSNNLSKEWQIKRSKVHRCRRRIWKRPRIRLLNKNELELTKYTEYIYEYERFLMNRWYVYMYIYLCIYIDIYIYRFCF